MPLFDQVPRVNETTTLLQQIKPPEEQAAALDALDLDAATPHLALSEIDEETTPSPSEAAERQLLSQRIDESIQPYAKTFISVSAALRFPPARPDSANEGARRRVGKGQTGMGK